MISLKGDPALLDQFVHIFFGCNSPTRSRHLDWLFSYWMKNIITWPSTTRPIEVAIIVIHAFLIDFLNIESLAKGDLWANS